MKNRTIILFVVFLVSVFFIPYGALVSQENNESKPIIHKVKKGDTLWDISTEYLKDPWSWPKIWQLNDFIENPHLIYPDQTIRIKMEVEVMEPSGPIVRRTAPRLDEEKFLTKEEIKEIAVPSIQPPENLIKQFDHPIPMLTEESLLRSGFIEKRENLPKSKVLTIQENEIWVTKWGKFLIDRGYNDGVKNDDMFLVFTISKPFKHPITKGKMGVMISVKGKARVIEVQESTAECQVVESFDVIRKNNRVMPYSPPTIPRYDALISPDTSIESTIISVLDPLASIHLYDVLFIDHGRDDEIQLGDRFEVYKRPQIRKPGTGEDEPLGVLKVVGLRPKTASTLLISHRLGKIEVGDRAILKARCRIVLED